MLQSVYSVYDRLRRPLRNHHYLVLPGGRLAYARIPGLAQSLARPILAALDAGAQDDGWFENVELLTARELGRRYPEIAIFALAQPPAERIAAAYETVIASGRPLPTFYLRHGFSAGMTPEAFVARISQIGDLRADNLFRSQCHMLETAGLKPPLVLGTDRLERRWEELAGLVRAATGRTLPPPPPCPAPSDLALQLGQGATGERIRRRYARDLRLYFAGSGPELARAPADQGLASARH
ncbi:hypothetical protein [Pannonibacter tanglangensis]|uniref:Sulphotransferase Stf0 domain-containing protein n=1 Tax=Pannonibacter tanglangensis TaxID=2750084 RepID=A0ABW9ZCK9_9HYPH|nr:hypothetical protein [Pannonibacter sp. XCT-34]NBN62236.1 hypothetical protein [Pannonibacter sp. XCT-34]